MTANRLGIDTLGTFGLPPLDAVQLSAELGCAYMSLLLQSLDYARNLPGMGLEADSNPHGYAPYDLKTDPQLRRELRSSLLDNGVTISLAEGISVKPGTDVATRTAEFDWFAELGAERLNFVTWDPDLARTIDEFGVMIELCAERGMRGVIEFLPTLSVGDLPTALEVIRQLHHPDLGLCVDTMHFGRSGVTPAEIAALDPALIGYIQLNDVPDEPQHEHYMVEAALDRRLPGDGDLPLLEYLRAMPRDVEIGIEIPMMAKARAGIGPLERFRPAVAATRELLAQLD